MQEDRRLQGVSPTLPPFPETLGHLKYSGRMVTNLKALGRFSVEFGKPSAQAINECRLFSVEANKLPAPGRDQSFTAFDSRC